MVPLIRIAQRRRRSRISICVIAIRCQLGAGVLLTELEDGLKDRVGFDFVVPWWFRRRHELPPILLRHSAVSAAIRAIQISEMRQ